MHLDLEVHSATKCFTGHLQSAASMFCICTYAIYNNGTLLTACKHTLPHTVKENIQEGCKPECRLQLTEFTVDVLKVCMKKLLHCHFPSCIQDW